MEDFLKAGSFLAGTTYIFYFGVICGLLMQS